MPTGINCPDLNAYRRDPKFQQLMQQDAYKGYSDKDIAYALILYIERNYPKYDITYIPETPQERGAFTRYLKYQLRRDSFVDPSVTMTQKGVQDMYESLYGIFTPTQLASRIDLLYDAFLRAVDKLQREDKTGRSRQELIKAYGDEKQNGYSKIMANIFAHYEKKYSDPEKMKAAYKARRPDATQEELDWVGEYVFNEWQTIFANKERIAALAARKIGETEGFLVKIEDNMTVSLTPLTDEELTAQEENQQQQDGTDYDEGQKGERYVDFRLIKLMDTLGPRARRLISRIPRIDANGEYSRDDLGLKRYLDNRQVAVTLTKLLRYSTPDTFMEDLKSSLDSYPWLLSIIKRLEDNSQARQTLYTAFKKAGITYLTTYKDGGSYTTKIANSSSQGRALMREAGNNLQEGWVQDEEKSVFTTDGRLKSVETLNALREEVKKFASSVMKDTAYIRMVEGDEPSKKPKRDYEGLPGPQAMAAYLRLPENAEVLKTLAKYVRGLGFSITADDIKAVVMQPMSKKSFAFINENGWQGLGDNGRNKLYQLAHFVDSAYGQVLHVREKVGVTGMAFYSSSDNEMSTINDILALSKYEEIEPRVVLDGKSQSALQNPNLLNDIVDQITNKQNLDEEKYQQIMRDEYLNVEGMSTTDRVTVINAATNKPEVRTTPRYTGWLKWLYDGVFDRRYSKDNVRNSFRIVKLSGFNNKPYAQLTRPQKITSALLAYFDSYRTFGKENYRLYEVPLQGDYGTAYDFLLAPKLELGLTYNEATGVYEEAAPVAGEELLMKPDTILDALVDEVRCELERIQAIEDRVKKDKNGDTRPLLKVYEQEGSKFQIFPEFNDNGFREMYTQFGEDADAAEKFIRRSIVEQLNKVIARDINTINESGVLSNSLLASRGLVAKEGKVENLSREKQQQLVDFFLNDYYARLQMVKILDGGLHQFNGVVDFEKRNMLLHAPRSPLYTLAEWNGKRVGRENQNCIYIEDEESESYYMNMIDDSLKALKKEKFITDRQYRSMKRAYQKIKSTDGFGVRSLDSYRAVRVMTDNWDDRHEEAYKRIKAGSPTKGDIDLFMEGLKLVTTGAEFIPIAGSDKRIKLTVLHKYSEQVLLPIELARYCVSAQSVPLQAFSKVTDAMEKQGKPIDLFVFGSGVKVGGHSLTKPLARWGDLSEEERVKWGYQPGKDKLTDHFRKSADDIAGYMLADIKQKPWTVHTIPFKYTGIAASTTPHEAEDRIARSSQMEKALYADIMPEDMILLRDKEEYATWGRDTYYEIKTAEIVEAFESVRKVFGSQKELSSILNEELATKSYYSSELPYAIKALQGGKFALPMFSPGIEHPIQQLLASVIKKRMTKQKGKGSNLMISSGLGLEMDVSSYEGGLDDQYKLGITTDDKGRNWLDTAVPLPESLKPFANKEGIITPEMLWGKKDKDGKLIKKGLVQRGIIPEEALYCLAARNPADAIHSAMPLRIKWFLANVEGAGAKVSKEAMVTTGQDFDGDKLRFDFKEWNIVWNEDLLQKDFEEILGGQISLDDEVEIMRNVLGQSTTIRDFEAWKRWALSDANPEIERYKKVEVIEYDFKKTALKNDSKQRHNGQMELMLAQLTSPAGWRRMLMAGGCEDSKVYAKAIYLTKQFRNHALLGKLVDFMTLSQKQGGLGLSETSVESMVSSASSFYTALSNMSDYELTKLMKIALSAEAPYSFSHAVDAFETIVGGKEMISTYAVYNSTAQMLQRLNLQYIPLRTKNGAVRTVGLFGKTIGNLFDVRSKEVTVNSEGEKVIRDSILASIALSHLVNAAVDNNKDPILGYLNQTREMSEMTYFLVAAGYNEEEIHLLMNQPVIVELAKRMKGKRASELGSVVEGLTEEVRKQYNLYDETYSWWKALDDIASFTPEQYAEAMQFKFDSLPEIQQPQQIAVLELFKHLAPSAATLAEFTRLVRPETSSGAIGSTIASIINKAIRLNSFRDKFAEGNTVVGRIYGMKEVLERRDVQDGWEASTTMKALGTQLPEVVAQNSLMMDTALDMFAPFFPEAKFDWYEKAAEIVNMYSYESVPDSLIERVAKEMILWKLFQKVGFVQGDHRAEQEKMLIDVPFRLKKLKERIAKAKQNPQDDPEAAQLIGNMFLENLSVTDPSDGKNPRLRFMLNGPAIEGQADVIRYGWNQLLHMGKEIRTLAHDLFKYNMYTAGFGYGMYEFAHFAPMSVLLTMPGYTQALNDILRDSWGGPEREAEWLNFKGQYVRNHWGDDRFLTHVNLKDTPNGVRELFHQESLGDAANKKALLRLAGKDYIVVQWDATTKATGKKKKVYKLVWLNAPGGPRVCELLGVRGRSGQITLQYNPGVDIADNEVTPVIIGNDTPWGDIIPTAESVDATANYNAPDNNTQASTNWIVTAAKAMGLNPVSVNITAALNAKVDTANTQNTAVLEKLDKAKAPATQPGNTGTIMGGGIRSMTSLLSGVDMSALEAAKTTDFEDGMLVPEADGSYTGPAFSIARVDEKGDVVIDKVPASPNNIRLARRQRVQAELNAKLRDILRKRNVSVGVLTETEARLRINGVTDFDTAEVLANGMVEMIRLREGYRGEEALPEEFAHFGVALIGKDNAFVKRILADMEKAPEAMREAFDDQYEDYLKEYKQDLNAMRMEALGKLVSKHLFREQQIQTYTLRGLIMRLGDAIKDFIGRFSRDEIQKAIFDANRVARGLARELLGGRILDNRTLQDLKADGKMYSKADKVKKDLSDKEDILSRMLKTEVKKLKLLQARQGYNKVTPGQGSSIDATKAEIARLEKSIEEHKLEDAIVGYMQSGLVFIKESSKKLEEVIMHGLPANKVCKRLNAARDILLSYTTVIQAVRDAIVDGEVPNSKMIQDAVSSLESVLGNFYTYYNTQGMHYLERMLAGVYGENGLVVNVGKDRGRHITIEWMARHADRDISFMSRWFNSVADNNDFVLKAMDSIVRDAKQDAFEKTGEIRRMLVQALDEYEKATGSRDQKFMFEYELGDDGKMHKTGKYITAEQARTTLSDPQKVFYKTMMDIKSEIDKLVPESMIEEGKIVMLRKLHQDKVRESDGIKQKVLEEWEGIRNMVLDTSDDIDFDTYEVSLDFGDNPVDLLPLKYLAKGKSETYDDMSDDVATSILAYAGMANEYAALNGVIGILENAKYMATRRDVGQHVGTREMIENVSTEEMEYKKPFRVKQARTKIQDLMEDFMQMQVYGHLQSNEGTIGRTRISKRKAVNFVTRITSLSQMALNLPQRVTNVSVGGAQIFVEGMGGSEYNAKNFRKASHIWIKESADRLAETGKMDYDNKLSLFLDKFDIHQNNKGEFQNANLGRSRVGRVFNSSLLFAGLTIGEDYLSSVTALSVAMNIKLIDTSNNNKQLNLWEAYEVRYADPVNKTGAYLKLKDGVRKEDGSEFTAEDERAYANKVIGMNFDLQGIYNQNDRSAVQQYAAGALIIMYRKWIAPALKRRYGRTQFSVLKGGFEEGYYRTWFRTLIDSMKDARDIVSEDESLGAIGRILATAKEFRNAYLLNYDKMTDYEKSNLKKAWTEFLTVIGLWISTGLLLRLPPDDKHDDDFLGWAENFGLSQLLRLRTELAAQAPTPLTVREALRIIKSPFAAITPIQDTLNAFQLLLPHNYLVKVRSGRYKGHSRAYKYFREFPIISMFKKVENFIDPTPMLQYYKTDTNYWNTEE